MDSVDACPVCGSLINPPNPAIAEPISLIVQDADQAVGAGF
jgi:hypothetical protein